MMIKSGIINVNKCQNMTSHDVVAMVRRTLGIKRVGHTGTLDPMAMGVLPVAVGNATKFIEYLDKDRKTYIAGVKLGIMTDTLDVWGNILANDQVSIPSRELEAKLSEVIPDFTGQIQQIPPKYSAIKVNGKRLYDYARKGQDVEIPSRTVNIYKLEYISPEDTKYLESLTAGAFSGFSKEKSDFFLLIECSRGTYVRSIIRDIGDRLGVDVVMSFLVRTASGSFQVEDGVSADKIKYMSADELADFILPIDEWISCMGSLVIDQTEGKKFQNGGKISLKKITYLDKADNESLFKVYQGDPSHMEDLSSMGNLSNEGELCEVKGDNKTGKLCNIKFLGIGRIVDERFLKGEKIIPVERQ